MIERLSHIIDEMIEEGMSQEKENYLQGGIFSEFKADETKIRAAIRDDLIHLIKRIRNADNDICL